MKKWKILGFILSTVSVISACSSTPLDINEPDPASIRLAQVAESIQKHDNDLADIEMARYLETHGAGPEEIDVSKIPSLERIESLGAAWHGPIDKLVIKLSVLAGLNPPRFLSVKPSSDVIVNVNTDYRRIIDMLHDAGTQAGSRANVTLKVKERLIEVEYLPYF
ncbi:DotD/TraH family lipoprotein [Microbulbifer epialgicus]|uniref:DotD/TraH family lipoprotein n=1 Tax=Microbulbifer epialgicus TaxID=393907 RepID=A0ABV4NUE6_9GAMM